MKPNIILITCHDLGTHLGCYGQRTVVSPCLDRFAADGCLFTRAFCTSPLCSPSRASLHTGRYPHSTGVMGLTHPPFSWRLNPDERHLAQLLAENDYNERVLIGFQHVSMEPATLGYNRCDFKLASAEEVADGAVGFLKNVSASPFYLEVGFFETHRPFNWGGAMADVSRGVSVPYGLPETEAVKADCAALQGAVASLDRGVGRILVALREYGLEENTWVIFTTDHGLPMVRAKSTLYDPGLETSLIMRWPGGGLSGGRVCDDLWSHVDLVPTLFEGCGLMIPPKVQGCSFWQRLQGSTHLPRSHVFGEKTYHTGYEPMRAIRSDRYKLIVNFENGPAIDVPTDVSIEPGYCEMLPEVMGLRVPVEFYDLSVDPNERNNLANNPDYLAIRRQLLDQLLAWMQETGDPLLEGPVASPFRSVALTAFNHV